MRVEFTFQKQSNGQWLVIHNGAPYFKKPRYNKAKTIAGIAQRVLQGVNEFQITFQSTDIIDKSIDK